MVRPGLATPVRREQYQLFRPVLCGRNADAGLYYGALCSGRKNSFSAYADVGRRPAGAQGKL